MGFVGGVACYGGVMLKTKFGYDDALDVVGIHGFGGTVGAILTGVFCVASVNGVDGLLAGNPAQVGIQAVSVVGTWVYVYIVSRIILAVVNATIGIRATADEEVSGLDLNLHNERGYNI